MYDNELWSDDHPYCDNTNTVSPLYGKEIPLDVIEAGVHLSKYQRLMVEWYAVLGDRLEAARRAGYSEASVNKGTHITKLNKNQLSYLSKIIGFLSANSLICTALERQMMVSEKIRECYEEEGKDNEFRSYVELLNKMQGTYVAKVEDVTPLHMKVPPAITLQFLDVPPLVE